MTDTQSNEKIGLALSGGGFRAAFFHIGVLAQMARLGMLRHVEVISTVSGGSVIGALYYLHLKTLFEQKPDAQILDHHYREIIRKIETDFLQAVERNLRMSAFLHPFKNLKMASADYSRTDRMAELYDEYFYRAVLPNQKDEIEMRNVKIRPRKPDGTLDKDFHPKKSGNAQRSAKVPILLINATTLNTGHNWRFEASRMGEPFRVESDQLRIDKNLRLQRPQWYDCLRKRDLKGTLLGDAVAASTCVPGIYPPLPMQDMYPGLLIQLVDGGVHDNQGIQALLDEHCTHFVVSDASGHLRDEDSPNPRFGEVLGRSSSVLTDRIREEQLRPQLEAQKNDKKPFAFLHLREGIPVKDRDYMRDSQVPHCLPLTPVPPQQTSLALFDVDPQVQDFVSRIRTDLDSFTEVEAYSLMLDGYHIGEYEFSKPEIQELFAGLMSDPQQAPPFPWSRAQPDIDKIKKCLREPSQHFHRQLQVAGENLFKIFRLSWGVTIITLALLGGLFYLLFFQWSWMNQKIRALLDYCLTLRTLLVAVLLLVLGLFAPRLSRAVKWLRRLQPASDAAIRLFARVLLPLLASLFVAIHLLIFDRLFLRQGRLSRLKLHPPAKAAGGE